jgi:glycosyltransferase involved in cell wall biosynthesis
MKTIGFNMAFVDPSGLTGPGFYAAQLFESAVGEAARDGMTLIAWVQQGALHHFSERARRHIRPVRTFRTKLGRVLWEQLVLPFHARRARTDLLFSPAFVSPVWGAPKLVVTICDMYYRVVPHVTPRFQRLYWNVMIPLSSKACDRIITISGHSMADIERYLPSARGRTMSIPLASRFEARTAAKPAIARRTETPFVLMVANMTANKNCEVVVKAVKQLNDRGRPVTLIHAGQDFLGLLKAAIADQDASAFVALRGRVSDEELEALYDSSLAVVVASLYEGFGMPAVEAQAMGAPLICSDRSALPEAAGEGALYFNPEDAEALSAQIEQVMNMTAEQRSTLIQRGHASAARFSWALTAERTLDTFEQVLAGK